MGKVDDELKDYIDSPDVFADIVNGYLYGGKQVVLPENLEELDPTLIFSASQKDEEKSLRQKVRDKYRRLSIKTDGKAAYIIVGVEGQATVNYAMPVKCMSYDAGEYEKQVKKFNQLHVEMQDYKGRTSGEFLWKFFKEDYLIPVITVVVNLSSEPWDGPRSLYDMFHINDPTILSLVENYRIHLIDPHTMSLEEMEKFETNLREVLTFIKFQKDKNTLRKMTEINPRFKRIKRNAQRMIEVCTRWKFKEKEKEVEEVDMCQALREMVEDAREEGRQEMCLALKEVVEDAREEGRQEMCQALKEMVEDARVEGRDDNLIDNLKSIMEKLSISAEKAMELLDVPNDKHTYYVEKIKMI